MSPKDFPQIQTAMANQQYCLKWNNHQVNLLKAFDRLLRNESFTDVTLACEGQSCRAHKVVLSACSSYFEKLFEEHPDKSPIIILKDMKYKHVDQLVKFMYKGEINITQDQLSGLLRTAETLKVKGLAEVSGEQNNAAAAAAAAAVAAAHQFAPIGPGGFAMNTSLPQMMSNHNSVLTAALNAPISSPNLGPLAAALLNPDHEHFLQASLEERRACLLKRISSQDEDSSGEELQPMPKMIKREDIKTESPSGNLSHHSLSPLNIMNSLPNQNNGNSLGHQLALRLGGGTGTENSVIHHKHILPASQPKNLSSKANNGGSVSLAGSQHETSPGGQPVLTPIPHDLTVNAQQELPEFLQGFSVYRLNDYLGFRTRQQFWEELAVRRIMEGIKNKEIDMKSAAEILGVSYGTLYGRYREVFGYLKHAWVNKPGRSPSSSGSSQRERSLWDETRSQDLVQKVLNKELSLTAAAVRLGVDYNTFFAHLTDDGKNQARVSLLTGGAGGTTASSSEYHRDNASPIDDEKFHLNLQNSLKLLAKSRNISNNNNGIDEGGEEEFAEDELEEDEGEEEESFYPAPQEEESREEVEEEEEIIPAESSSEAEHPMTSSPPVSSNDVEINGGAEDDEVNDDDDDEEQLVMNEEQPNQLKVPPPPTTVENLEKVN